MAVDNETSSKPFEKANESARDQFAALGRFIQAFEFIVSILRDDCARILAGAQRGVSIIPPTAIAAHWKICSLAFHHEIMTARPLAEIWRALIIEQSRGMVSTAALSKEGMSVVEQVTTSLHNKFTGIIDRRNKLVHASWSIGRWITDENLDALLVEKYSITKNGLKMRDDLPKTFGELMALGSEAADLSTDIGRFTQFYRYHPELIEKVFVKKDTEWTFEPPAQSAE